MSSVTTRHIDNVMSIAMTGSAARGPQALFYRSWERCVKQHGLDPTRPTPARIVPSEIVREHQQRMEGFLRVARSGMEDMYRRVADLGYMLLLTDADGITVDYIGNPASEQQLKAAGLYVGADWNEAHAGTCGVGTCLIEQTTITCHQAEHFDATHIALTCTSAPLFAPDGQMLGVLDVSALHSPEARESQYLALQMASMYAQQIEDANFLRSFGRHAILRLGTAPGLVEVSGDAMFAFDDDGVILGANTGARRRFGTSARQRPSDSRLVGSTLLDVLGTGMDALRAIERGASAAAFVRGWPSSAGPLHAAVIRPRGAATPAPAATLADRVPPPVARTSAAAGVDRLFGDDAAMRELVEQAKRLVNHRVNLMISGETGSGKEVLARALHAHSRRAAKPFVAVNCASIPETLIESELFGYTPGSFTGGKSKGMKGLIAQSDGGTLFLDEIGDMPLALQTRLLRVLSECEVLPLGAERPIAVELNVIAATHRDLRDRVVAGSFREDLYYRLCGATLRLPPLRERDDKPYLIRAVFEQEARDLGASSTLSGEAMQALLGHAWPGNLRELRNALRFALALSDGGPIPAKCLPPNVLAPRASPPKARPAAASRPSHDADEAPGDGARLLEVLRTHHWNVTSTARTLGICRATVYRKMKRHGITAPHLL